MDADSSNGATNVPQCKNDMRNQMEEPPSFL